MEWEGFSVASHAGDTGSIPFETTIEKKEPLDSCWGLSGFCFISLYQLVGLAGPNLETHYGSINPLAKTTFLQYNTLPSLTI